MCRLVFMKYNFCPLGDTNFNSAKIIKKKYNTVSRSMWFCFLYNDNFYMSILSFVYGVENTSRIYCYLSYLDSCILIFCDVGIGICTNCTFR